MSVRWEYTEAEQAAILATFPDKLRDLEPEPERRFDPELLRENLLLNVALTVGFYREKAVFSPDREQMRVAADALASLATLAAQMLARINDLEELGQYRMVGEHLGLKGLRPGLTRLSREARGTAEQLAPKQGPSPKRARVVVIRALADLWEVYTGQKAVCGWDHYGPDYATTGDYAPGYRGAFLSFARAAILPADPECKDRAINDVLRERPHRL